MSSCLGLFIESNLIKYAKVTKDKNVIKVESFGVKFYDKINEAINQIISETYSYKIPISINLSDEVYNYYYMFSMLNKNDLKKAVETEFESYCYDKGINVNGFETRYALVENLEDKEKVKVIHISANRTELARKEQQLEGQKITTISPLPMTLSNLLDVKSKESVAIVNIENKTTITTVADQKIYNISIIEDGSDEILSKISAKENSYSKAYEICKNSTIYTLEGKDLQEQENEYLEEIMPTLYNIVTKVRKVLNENLENISKIYITGTASVINNIDLYFQEYLTDVECEILKPYFINNSGLSINIKDYVEVNSAIALALQGLNEGLQGINFKKPTISDSLPEFLKIDFGGKANKEEKSKTGKFSNIKFDFRVDIGEKLDRFEKNLLRLATSLLVLILIYSGFSIYFNKQIEEKVKETEIIITDTNQKISKVEEDITEINKRANKYSEILQRLQSINDEIANKYKNKNAIPNLLNQIMFVIPQNVQITSIQNTSGNIIEIKAQTPNYEQIGYFKAKLKSDYILKNITSDSGIKQDNLVKVTIRGELL